MKGVLIFTAGFVVGIIVTIIAMNSEYVTEEPYDGLYGLSIFSEKGECIPTEGRIEVLQVLKPNMALAQTGEYLQGPIVLLINYDGKSYYDDQEIKVPSGKCARQIGTYQYSNRLNTDKTVPAVVIE